MASKEIIYVGCDDGYAEIKLAYCTSGDPVLKTLSIPSRAVQGNTLQGLSGVSENAYETDALVFTIKNYGDFEDTRFDGYPTSPLCRVLVHHALRRAGLGGEAIKLCTGLPPRDYFGVKDGLNATLITGKVKSFSKPVRSMDNTPVAQILEHQVFSESLAAVVDHLFDLETGNFTPLDRPMGVIDIGGRTTDCIVVVPNGQGGFQVEMHRTGSVNHGVLNIHDRLATLFAEQINSDLTPQGIPSDQLDIALRTGILRLYGKDHKVDYLATEATKYVSSQLGRAIERTMGKVGDLEQVLFVGGGAKLMEPLIDGFRTLTGKRNESFAVVAPEPQFANARGMYKFMKFMALPR